jgi:xylulokinase
MQQGGISPKIIRAGKANMFQSDVFSKTLVNTTGIPVELYENDGSVGAAIGAGIGVKVYKNYSEAFAQFKPVKFIEPENTAIYKELYSEWKSQLALYLNKV